MDYPFDPVLLEQTRTAVLSDFDRFGSVRSARRERELIPFRGSRYALRPPEGKRDSFAQFQPDRLRLFYADWYRPDLMAVVVVGDVEVAPTVALIGRHLAPIAPRATPRPRLEYPLADASGTAFQIDAHTSNFPMSDVDLYWRSARRFTGTLADSREEILHALARGILVARLTRSPGRRTPPSSSG